MMAFIDSAWKLQYKIENHLNHVPPLLISVAFAFLVFVVFHLSICKTMVDLVWFFVGSAILIFSIVIVWLSTSKKNKSS